MHGLPWSIHRYPGGLSLLLLAVSLQLIRTIMVCCSVYLPSGTSMPHAAPGSLIRTIMGVLLGTPPPHPPFRHLAQVYAVGHYLFSVIDAKVLQRAFLAAAVTLVSGVAAVLVAAQLLGLVQWTGRSLTLLDPTYASK